MRLLSGWEYSPVSGEVNTYHGWHLAEWCLVVVAEEHAPPVAAVVAEISGATAARHCLVAHAVGTVDVFRNGGHAAVAALVLVGGGEVVQTVALEQRCAFVPYVGGAAALGACAGVVRGHGIGIEEYGLARANPIL